MKKLNKEQLEIIMVDDDADDQAIFKEALKEANPHIKLCVIKNEQELAAFFKSKSVPYLFFVDWSFRSFFEKKCLDLIKEQDHLKNVPLIIYSDYSSEENIKYLYDKGASLFLNKPTSYSTLIEILKTIVNLKWDTYSLQQARYGLLSEFIEIEFPV